MIGDKEKKDKNNFITLSTTRASNGQEKKKKDLNCVNCGKNGHYFKECSEPITSYGIILINYEEENLEKKKEFYDYMKKIKFQDENTGINSIQINESQDIELFCKLKNKIKFLMIRRKHTLGFLEFIRGRYNIDNVEGIIFLFKQMTQEEIDKIKIKTFDDLWLDIWGNNQNKFINNNEYQQSKIKFEKLKNENNGYLTLDFYTKNVKPEFEFAEWGFPKGRRNYRETNLECAIREFNEETAIENDEYLLLEEILPIEEYLTGTNGINYKHVYYLAFCKAEMEMKFMSEKMINIQGEIGDISFNSFERSIELIRPYHTERQKIITGLYIYYLTNLMNFYKSVYNIPVQSHS